MVEREEEKKPIEKESFCYTEKWKWKFIFKNDIGLEASTSKDQNLYTKRFNKWVQIEEGRQYCKRIIKEKESKVLLDSVWNMGKT